MSNKSEYASSTHPPFSCILMSLNHGYFICTLQYLLWILHSWGHILVNYVRIDVEMSTGQTSIVCKLELFTGCLMNKSVEADLLLWFTGLYAGFYKVHCWLVLKLLYIFQVCSLVGLCIPLYHMCNNCNATWLQLTSDSWLSTGVAVSNLAQEFEMLNSRDNIDVMTRGWTRVKMPEVSNYSWYLCSYRLTNWLRIASKRALESIRMFEGLRSYCLGIET